MFTIVLLGFALSMDALAVSVSAGIKSKSNNLILPLKLAVTFGFFQALMPFIGYMVGAYFKNFIEVIDHWIAFILLVLIGVNMIRESLKPNNDEKEFDGFHWKTLLILAIATSIDALVAGITFVFMDVNLYASLAIIFAMTFVICFLGTLCGKLISKLIDNKMEIVGGLILIAIGSKILIEHLFF